MSEHVIISELKGLMILQSQFTLLGENIGLLNMLIEVVNDHAHKALSFNEILCKILSGSLVIEIAVCTHLVDQFHCNFEVLQWESSV